MQLTELSAVIPTETSGTWLCRKTQSKGSNIFALIKQAVYGAHSLFPVVLNVGITK